MSEWFDWRTVGQWLDFNVDSLAILGMDPLYVHFILPFLLLAGGVWLLEPVTVWLISVNWKRLLTFLVISLAVTNLLISIQLYQVVKLNQTVAEEALSIQLSAVLVFGLCYTCYGLMRQTYRFFAGKSKTPIRR